MYAGDFKLREGSLKLLSMLLCGLELYTSFSIKEFSLAR